MWWPFSTSRLSEVDIPIFLTNTASGKKERFIPLKPGTATLYSCGPTVYSKQHIGNLKAPLFSDILARTLQASGYRVRRVINITDVGHLQSDADEGEDKMEVGAQREGQSAKEIADRYTSAFLEDLAALNIDTKDISFPRATEYIQEQIEMIEALEKGGHTYRTHDGIYFDTSTFPEYGKLGNLSHALSAEEMVASVGRRISENKEKRHAADFALWKFSPSGSTRQQEWKSPWGTGFPGWHIECSAMSKALLGPEIDLHTGGMDHIPVHHNNEIAQSESLSHKPFVRYWMHEAFVTMQDEKISKSIGNVVYLSDVIEKGFHPLALRYFFLQSHYRSPISFTWEALAASSEALARLWRHVAEVNAESRGKRADSSVRTDIVRVLRDDLGTPQALALVWQALKDDTLSAAQVMAAVEEADTVLGLSLRTPPASALPLVLSELPEDLQTVAKEREEARKTRDFAKADELRIHIENRGYRVEDSPSGPLFTRNPE